MAMGVDFRGKDYVRRVRIGKRTVKEGEAAAVWNSYGVHTQREGPALVRLWWSTIRFLDSHVAGEDEYLRIRERGGTVRHERGPTRMYENPVYHLGVTVEPAIILQSSDHVCVIRSSEAAADKRGGAPARDEAGGGASSQVVVKGPRRFFPEADVAVCAFEWGANANEMLLQGGRVINLRAPAVLSVQTTLRGADNHEVRLVVQARVRLSSVERVLEITSPLSACERLVNTAVIAVAADMQVYALAKGRSDSTGGGGLAAALQSKFRASDFREGLADSLREHAACDLLSFVLIAVEPSESLQKLLKRDEDLLASRLQEKITDEALAAAAARQEKEHQLEAIRQAHELKLQEERDQARCKLEAMESDRELKHLGELKGMGVDLTGYLVSRNVAPRSVAIEGDVVRSSGCIGCTPRFEPKQQYRCN